MGTDKNMDSQQEESHDLDQNVDNTRGSQLSPLQLLLRVKQPEGQASPPCIYTPDIIATICVQVAVQSPTHVSILNGYEALHEFKAGAITSTVILELSHETQWYGFPVMVSWTIFTQSGLQEIHLIRRGIHQGLVEVRRSEEVKPKIDLEEVRDRILYKLVELIR